MKLELVGTKKLGTIAEKTLQIAFDVAQTEYGLDKIDGTVRLKVGKPDLTPLSFRFTTEGVAILVNAVEGGTSDKILPGNVINVKLTPSNTDMANVLHVWCHELAHVAQSITGRLVGGPASGPVWLGRKYKRAELEELGHDKWPWEMEANAEADRIMPKVDAALDKYIASPEGTALLLQAVEKRKLEEAKKAKKLKDKN